MLRTLGAFMVAPFPVALFQSVVVGLWPKEGMGVFENPPSMFVALCIYFYVIGIVLALPAWLVLRKRAALGMRAYAVIGLVAALIPIAVALAVMIGRGPVSSYIIIYNLVLFGAGGLLSGALFSRLAHHNKSSTTRPSAVGR